MTTIVYIVIALVVAALAYWIFHRNSQLPASGPALQKAMGKQATRAVAQGRRFNARLDYSAQSIQKLEELLSVMTQLRATGKMSDKLVEETSLVYGAYIGEVVRRSKGGAWMRDHLQFGPSCFPFVTGGNQFFPVTWCEKRIENGSADNVWLKYQSLVAAGAIPA